MRNETQTRTGDETMASKAIKAIQDEMMARRRELIDLQKQQGGCVAISLKADKLQFIYNPDRKVTASNPHDEKFYISGTMNSCPAIMNESDVYLFDS